MNNLIKQIYFKKFQEFIQKVKLLSINHKKLNLTIKEKRKCKAFNIWYSLHKKKESAKRNHLEHYFNKLKEKVLTNWCSISKIRMKYRFKIEKLLKLYATNLKAKSLESLKKYYDLRRLSVNYKKLSTFFMIDNKVRKIFSYLKYSTKISKLQKLISYKISMKTAKEAFISWIHLYYRRANENQCKRMIINKRILKMFMTWKLSMKKNQILCKLFDLKINYLKLWFLKKWVNFSIRKSKKFRNH